MMSPAPGSTQRKWKSEFKSGFDPKLRITTRQFRAFFRFAIAGSALFLTQGMHTQPWGLRSRAAEEKDLEAGWRVRESKREMLSNYEKSF